MDGPLLPREKLVESLESLIAPQDQIVLEGDNQKQADFLSRSSVKVDPKKLHDLHLIISSISRPEQLTLFELGIAKKIDFAYACPQSLRVHSCLKTVSSKSAPFTPKSRFTRVCLSTWHRKLCWFTAEQADRDGNLYTGPSPNPPIESAQAGNTRVQAGARRRHICR